ncbi:MAG: hypothetical protein GY749_38355 [Desulfobacteraceae bacterium]|nr:hypothetical protein [Desulfobacteraceae bacterium]
MNEFGNIDHKIYQGNAIEVLQNEIKDNSVDLIFVDPHIILEKILMVEKISGKVMKII